MGDLFQAAASRKNDSDPLADRMRPQTLAEVQGQVHLLSDSALFRRLVEAGRAPSMILWGPPGTGKTTLARLVAKQSRIEFVEMSAVLSGVADLRKVLAAAQQRRGQFGERTMLFVDEIHRWSKNQQDALLDAVERGYVTLVGATTENPSFELNSALLSRCRVFVLESLEPSDMKALLQRAIADSDRGLGRLGVAVEDDALNAIADHVFGDARRALTVLEMAVQDAALLEERVVTHARVEEALAHKALLYDKAGDAHYGVVSAFIKSLRGSDPDAAVYYLARMLESGEDPRFVLRRLVIFASEDVGNADPMALVVATSALTAFELMGLPEGALPLTQATTYLACAPKSNQALLAYGRAAKEVRETGPLPVPPKLLAANSGLQKMMGHGKNYRYPHDLGGVAPGESYLPEALEGRRYYTPALGGSESQIAARLETFRALVNPTKK